MPAFDGTVTALDLPAKRLTTQTASLYTTYAPPQEEAATLRLIPYYTWANRTEGEMRVWLRV